MGHELADKHRLERAQLAQQLGAAPAFSHAGPAAQQAALRLQQQQQLESAYVQHALNALDPACLHATPAGVAALQQQPAHGAASLALQAQAMPPHAASAGQDQSLQPLQPLQPSQPVGGAGQEQLHAALRLRDHFPLPAAATAQHVHTTSGTEVSQAAATAQPVHTTSGTEVSQAAATAQPVHTTSETEVSQAAATAQHVHTTSGTEVSQAAATAQHVPGVQGARPPRGAVTDGRRPQPSPTDLSDRAPPPLPGSEVSEARTSPPGAALGTYIYLSTHLSTSIYICLSTHLSISIYICLSTHLSISIYICLTRLTCVPESGAACAGGAGRRGSGRLAGDQGGAVRSRSGAPVHA